MRGNRPYTIAFVLPWYGREVVGGAEVEARKLAQNLRRLQGLPVEILTTCAKDGLDGWSRDFYRPGVEDDGGVAVRRFRLDSRPQLHFAEINERLLRGETVSADKEALFMAENVRSSGLFSYIGQNRDRYRYVFLPYLYGTTYWGSLSAPERSFLIPCLHDEGQARMQLVREMFGRFRRVLFHTPAERDLAGRLFALDESQTYLLGEGVDVDVAGDAASFRRKYGVEAPFVLYVGRRGAGKNTPLLVDYFCRFKERSRQHCLADLKLVFVGKGPIDVPPEHKGDVLDLGFLPEQDKLDAYAAALVTCQPSTNESFSIVLMESWVQGTPVLVNERCEVTRDHCLRSNGGLFFASYLEFEACLRYLGEDPAVRKRLGELGGAYVRANSSWERITKRFVHAVCSD